MFSDEPISNNQLDELERIDFCNSIADFLIGHKNCASIAVGLEGTWGTGKSSCLNMVINQLETCNPQPIIVTFNPWVVSTLDSLLQSFLTELASAVGTYDKGQNARDVAAKVLNYARFLEPLKLVPGVQPWGALVTQALKSVGDATNSAANLLELSLQDRKQKLEKGFQDLKAKVIIIIDDVDRLPPKQIRLVFEMLKATCDFPNTSYLIAYDSTPVVSALSYDKTYSGRDYLQKIIQINFQIPRISIHYKRSVFESGIQQIENDSDISRKDVENESLKFLIGNTNFLLQIDTLRTIKNILNRVEFITKTTRNEVSLADILVYCLLEEKFPEISRHIRNAPNHFIATNQMDAEFWSSGVSQVGEYKKVSSDKEYRKKFIENLVKPYNEEMHFGIRTLLAFSFPFLDLEEKIHAAFPLFPEQIRNRNSMFKLLHSGLTTLSYSSSEARSFLGSRQDRLMILRSYTSLDDFEGWIYFLETFVENETVVDLIGLCNLFMEECCILVDKGIFRISNTVSHLLIMLMEQEDDIERKTDILKNVLSNKVSLNISENVLLHYLTKDGIYDSGKYKHYIEEEEKYNGKSSFGIEYPQLFELKNAWLENMISVAETTGLIDNQQDPISLLYRWGQVSGDWNSPSNYLDNEERKFEIIGGFLGSKISVTPPLFITEATLRKFKEKFQDVEEYSQFFGIWFEK